MKSALCIGHAVYDITIPMESYPVENEKYYIKDVVECGGGSAGNAAAVLGKWGVETYFSGVVGSDVYGNKIEKEFLDINVNLDYFKKIDGGNTIYSFIIVNKSNASRTIFNNKNSDLKLENIKIDITPDLIMVDGYELDVVKEVISNNKNAIKVIDAGSLKPESVELSHMVDYLVCSMDFAEDYTNMRYSEDTIEDMFRKLEEEFGNTVVITLGEKGSIYRYNGKIKRLGIYKRQAVDTTGAGDIFHGAFCYCLLQGYDLDKCVRISSITSALSIEHYGGRLSIPELESVMSLYEQNVL